MPSNSQLWLILTFLKYLSILLQLFDDVFVEDPLFINEIAHTVVSQLEADNQRVAPKEKQINMVNSIGKLLEVLYFEHITGCHC